MGDDHVHDKRQPTLTALAAAIEVLAVTLAHEAVCGTVHPTADELAAALRVPVSASTVLYDLCEAAGIDGPAYRAGGCRRGGLAMATKQGKPAYRATRITRGCGLSDLATVLEKAPAVTISQGGDRESDATELLNHMVWKVAFLDQLVEVASTIIRHELDHLEWRYEDSCREAVTDVAYSAAFDRGYRSELADDSYIANDTDALRWLTEPTAPAVVLAKVAEYLEVETPPLIQAALERLEASENAGE